MAAERFHEKFRRRVKTQGSLPSEDAALVLLFSVVASGQIKLRRIDSAPQPHARVLDLTSGRLVDVIVAAECASRQ